MKQIYEFHGKFGTFGTVRSATKEEAEKIRCEILRRMPNLILSDVCPVSLTTFDEFFMKGVSHVDETTNGS